DRPPVRTRPPGPQPGRAGRHALGTVPRDGLLGRTLAFDRPLRRPEPCRGGAPRRLPRGPSPARLEGGRPATVVRHARRAHAVARDARRADRGLGPYASLLRRVRHAYRAAVERAIAALPELRPDRLSAHLAGDDGPGDPRPPAAARARRELRRQHVQRPGGLSRGRGIDRGSGATRSARGGRHRGGSAALLRQPELAVSQLADDRVSRGVCRWGTQARSGRARRRAMVRPREPAEAAGAIQHRARAHRGRAARTARDVVAPDGQGGRIAPAQPSVRLGARVPGRQLPLTFSLFSTEVTPSTSWASFSMRIDCSADGTSPSRTTRPSSVSTLIFRLRTSSSAMRADLTLAVIAASSALSAALSVADRDWSPIDEPCGLLPAVGGGVA